jgi:hypothetical protein
LIMLCCKIWSAPFHRLFSEMHRGCHLLGEKEKRHGYEYHRYNGLMFDTAQGEWLP